MPFIEIWCWDPIFYFNGHIELKLGDYTYGFEVDQRPRHERKLLNSERVLKNPLLGGWAGRVSKRTVDQEANIVINNWIQNQMKWKTDQLFVHVFKFEVSDSEYDFASMFLNSTIGNEPEYCFYSPDNSNNCVTFIVDAINKVGIFNYDFNFSITHEELQNFSIFIPESTNQLFEKFSDRLKAVECDFLKGPWPWIFFARLMQAINSTDSDTSRFRGYYKKQIIIMNSLWSLKILTKLIRALDYIESNAHRIQRLAKRHMTTNKWLKPQLFLKWLMQIMDFAKSIIRRIRWLIKKWMVNKHEWLVVK